jgi:hypothetical protein
MKSLSVVWEGNTFGDSNIAWILVSKVDLGDRIPALVQDLTSNTSHNYLHL